MVLNPLNSYQKWIGGQEAITVADNQSESELTADDWNNRGLEKQNSGDFTGAIEDYTEGINIDPNYALAYYNRGVARNELGDITGAIEDLEKAAELLRQQGDPRAAQVEEGIRQIR